MDVFIWMLGFEGFTSSCRSLSLSLFLCPLQNVAYYLFQIFFRVFSFVLEDFYELLLFTKFVHENMYVFVFLSLTPPSLSLFLLKEKIPSWLVRLFFS